MSKKLELEGQHFGAWLVLEIDDARRKRRWKCRCACGVLKSLRQSSLVSGQTLGCRSCRRPRMNLAGGRFGLWEVIERAQQDAEKRWFWKCRCSCGFIKDVSQTSLVSGKSTKCESCKSKGRPYECLFKKMKSRALRVGHAFSLTYENFLVYTGVLACCYCWAPVFWSKHLGGGGSAAYNLDRQDSEKGYHTNNLVVCCGRCNRAKNNLYTFKEWFAMTAMFRHGKRNAHGQRITAASS